MNARQANFTRSASCGSNLIEKLDVKKNLNCDVYHNKVNIVHYIHSMGPEDSPPK